MLGLALSGGGFRAAFLHLGVLAQMARLGLLRRVQVISTVSGGSTIGAFYCLRLRQLLAGKPEPGDADYIDLVGRLETDFLRVVQRNLRMRVYLDPVASLHLPASRLGELLDRYLYGGARVRDLAGGPRLPALILNATTLNTGHVWRIEPGGMGEAERSTPFDRDVDKNTRLLGGEADLTLGLAVAASAAFPGVYAPIELPLRYPDGFRVRLADGGIHDDRALESLVERGCDPIILSDASWQVDDETDPSSSVLGVALRSATVLLDRVREEQLRRLRPTMAAHLRRGWPVRVVSPTGSRIEPDPGSEEFGVDPRVQQRIGRLRIDFDSFTDVEAFSLMLDGYRMSERPLRALGGAPVAEPAFRFLEIEPWIQQPTPDYLRQLELGSHTFFKVFRRVRPVGMALEAAALLLAVALAWPLFPLLALAVAVQIEPGAPPWLRRPVEAVSHFLVRGLLPALLAPLVALHLLTIDRLFLWLGRLARLQEPRQTAGPAAATGPDTATAGA